MWKPLAVALTVFAVPALAKPPEVVVSIRPLHSLVAGVMQGLAEPKLLVQGNASPHTFSLRPSDARLLAEAGLVVMVDDGLEGFLAKPLAREQLAAVLPGLLTKKGGAGHGA